MKRISVRQTAKQAHQAPRDKCVLGSPLGERHDPRRTRRSHLAEVVVKITDVASDFGGVRVGDVLRIQRSRTRWQRFKHWIWARVFRRPDLDVFRITGVSQTVLTLDGSPEIPTGQAPVILKSPP